MPNPMYKYQMPTEILKDKIEELKGEADRIAEEYDRIIDEKDQKIAELEQRDTILTALENGGVDNWEYYDDAMKEV